jgi:small-conductance mechanosensitive channel
MRHHRFVSRSKTAAAACLLLLGLLASPATSQPPNGDSAASAEDRALVETAPVVVDGEPLFRLRGLSSYPAAHRAEIVADRIRSIASDDAIDPSTVQAIKDERDTRITAGNRPLMTVLEADAALEGVDHWILAQVYLEKIRNAIVAYRTARTREALLQSAWRAAVATLAALVVLFVLRRGFRALRSSVERRHSEHVSAANVRTFEAVRRERLWSLLLSMVRFVGNVSIALAVFLYLRYVLGLFPSTRGIAKQLAAWVFGPLVKLGAAVVDNLPNLFFLAILFLLTRYALRFIRVFFSAAGRGEPEVKGFDPEWAEPTYKLVRMLVIALAIVVAYPYIPGSDTPAFKGISVFAGVLISLGSSSAISNVVAGYILIYRRVFKEGDVVKIGDIEGRVTQVRLQVTHIRTIKNEEIVVPNSTIVTSEVKNYSTLCATDGLILHTTVGIGYDTPWQQVEAMLLEAAARTPGILQEPKPFVLQTALGDFAVTHQINVYCDTARTMARTYAALHRNILDVFNENDVQIMTPAYEGDPERPKVVPPEQWHALPAVKAQPIETLPAEGQAKAAGESPATPG